MANSEHVDLLKQGVEQWNAWRQENPESRPDLSEAYLRRINLRRVDLSGVNLDGADLIDTNLEQANFCGANLRGADLSMANLVMANLSMANLSGAKLNGADLVGSNLIGANLTDANLIGSDLNGADMIGANFKGANLSMAQALATNFTEATLTGVCLEDWNINSATRFESVVCDYIYLRSTYDAFRLVFQERRPSEGNKSFAPGEFARLFQKILSTAELIFRDGISWLALDRALNKLQEKAGREEILVQSMQSRENGEFVVCVTVPLGSDRTAMRLFVEEEYQMALKTIEQQAQQPRNTNYRWLEEPQNSLEIERRNNLKLRGVVETMAEEEAAKYNLRRNF